MTVLIVGGSGATGRLLLRQMIDRGIEVKAIVRSVDKIDEDIRSSGLFHAITASILDITDAEIAEIVQGCDALASCLGHNISLPGIFGQPRYLVTKAVQLLCQAIKANHPEQTVRFILMNTTSNSNRNIPEHRTFPERCAMGLIRILIPPQVDNESAADYLRTTISTADPSIAWVVVRPDTLINDAEVTEYELFPSPIRNPIFNPGKTSRENVAHFMAELMTDDELWGRWRGQMPVIYNK